jgi:4-amino-4-deoxy-L-arabinose transferase-like glycosyltransferase
MRIPPWRTQIFALLAFFAFAWLARWPTIFASVLDWDESLYLLMAEAWVHGNLPYTTIWDNKPLGIYAIFAAALTVGGHHVAAIRAASIIAVSLTAFAVFRIAFALLPATPVRLACALIAGLAYGVGALANDGLAANTEIFMACFTALALVTALSPGGPFRVGVVTGMLFAAAILTKYVAIFEAPAILLALLWFQPRATIVRRLAGAFTGGLLPLAAIIVTYALHGQLGLWWQDSVIANLARAGAHVTPASLLYDLNVQLTSWLPFYLAPFIMLLRWRDQSRVQIFLLIWLIGAAAGVASAKYFYDHYFQQILPVLCVITGLIFSRLAQRLIAPSFALFIAIPAIAGATAIWKIAARPDMPAIIANDLRGVLQPGQSVYVFDDQPVIYFLLNEAPPTRFVLPSTLTTNFLSRVAGVNAADEVTRILAARPAYIVINNFPTARPPDKNQTVYNLMSTSLAGHYHVWRNYAAATIYQINR